MLVPRILITLLAGGLAAALALFAGSLAAFMVFGWFGMSDFESKRALVALTLVGFPSMLLGGTAGAWLAWRHVPAIVNLLD